VLRRFLAHPLTRGLAADDPRATAQRRRIIKEKPFLRRLYCEWYERLLASMPAQGVVVELGSGAGFFSDFCPRAITSEVFFTPGVRMIADARKLPFADGTVAAIVMTDVFHHIRHVETFLLEARRCMQPGGKLLMIEPWRTRWSAWVYTKLHPEPFLPDADWNIPVAGPLSGANGALPWIVFKRDRKIFEDICPDFRLVTIEPMMPFAYLFSGGVSLRALMPGWAYRPIRKLERQLDQEKWAMFAFIELALRLD